MIVTVVQLLQFFRFGYSCSVIIVATTTVVVVMVVLAVVVHLWLHFSSCYSSVVTVVQLWL